MRVFAPVFGLIVIAGILLRFAGLDAMEFKGDEFKAFALAATHLHSFSLPLVGLQSSTGLFNPPFFLLLLWPPLLLKTDPVFVTGWIVLLNAAGIAGLVLLLRKLGGALLAFSTTAIIATSPWLFILSRKIWAQDALFPFLILTGWLLISYIRDRRPWQLWSAAASMALVTQLHMSAWALPLATVLWMALLHIRPRVRDIGIAVAIFLTLYAPYITFHVQDGFNNLSGTTTQDAAGILEQLRWLIGINGAVGLDYMWGPVTPAAIPLWLVRTAETATWLVGIGALAGLILIIRNILSTSSTLRYPQHLSALEQYVLFLLCVAIPSLTGYLVLGVPALPFYHLIFLPLIPLLCCYALTELPTKFHLPAMTSVGIIASIFLGLTWSFQNVTLHHSEQLTGDYGVPYRNDETKWAPYIEAVQNGRVRVPGE